MKRLLFYCFLIISLFLSAFGCHREISKEADNKELAEPNRIPPGHAELTGQIIEILPIDKSQNEKDPCSYAPCKARVKIESIVYGSGFPTVSDNSIVLKFNFTLLPTAKEMFPNMDDSYPGLNAGDKFTALAGFESIIGKDQPEYYVNGYKKLD
jgi:hypothetical protein